MPEREQRARMRLMRGLVAEFNVFRWAGRMLIDAARMRKRRRLLDRLITNARPDPVAPVDQGA
jgi:trehalose 6-phosphate synthase